MPASTLPAECPAKPVSDRRKRRGRAIDPVDQVVALERPDDVLNRVTAGMRAATIHKLLFDETEAAVILGVSGETMRVWRRDGTGPPWLRLGASKLVRYTYDGLVGYVATLEPGVAAARNSKEDGGKRKAKQNTAALIEAGMLDDDPPRAA
jgi:hypothetical protein